MTTFSSKLKRQFKGRGGGGGVAKDLEGWGGGELAQFLKRNSNKDSKD